MSKPIANYEHARALFDLLLTADTRERILLLEGESGTGKSTLLFVCLDSAGAIRQVRFSFKETAISVNEVFYRAGDMLGWEHFPRFLTRVDEMATTRVQVQGNPQVGINNKLEVALTGEKIEDQDVRLAELTKAWFADVALFHDDVLFVFDHFEKAGTPVQRWLSGPFLARAAGTPRLRVVIAGQLVPEGDNIEWGGCCRASKLTGVPEARHWLPVVQALNRHVGDLDLLSFLSGICLVHKGRPDAIMNSIMDLPELRPL
jgi:hypothetical protein